VRSVRIRFVTTGFLVAALVAALMVSPLGLAGCGGGSEGGSDGDSPAGHWEGAGASLDWPLGWRLAPQSNMPFALERVSGFAVQCRLSHSEPYGEIVLLTWDLAPGETPQSVFEQSYQTLAAAFHPELFRDVSGWSTSVGGLSALGKSYRAPSGEPFYRYWDVWVEHNGRLYVLTGWAKDTGPAATSPDLDRIRSDFDQIVASLHVSVAQ
jgi:hypothetical protein